MKARSAAMSDNTRPLSIAARRRIAEATLQEILHHHRITLCDLTSKHRGRKHVIARAELAQKLRAFGFKIYEIASVIGRDPTTVSYYLMTPAERGRENRAQTERRRQREAQHAAAG